MNKFIAANLLILILCFFVSAQETKTSNPQNSTEKAEAIIKKVVAKLGGEKYLQVKSLTGRGFFTPFKDGVATSPGSFIDYLIFPDKERTDFKTIEGKTIQTNLGDKGWIYDGVAKTITDQTPKQIENFQRGIRVSLDNFLRGGWRNEKEAKLEYVGKREAGLGKRNDVLRLTYANGFVVEAEFGVFDSIPAKILYKGISGDGEEIKEEDRFAQFVENQGVLTPFIIDHYINGKQTSRINYQTLDYNTPIADALFTKPTDIKKLK